MIRHLPGVTHVARSAMLLAALDDAPTRTVEALDADPSAVLVRGATEGRFVTVDRPALAEGRLPSGAHEAVVTVDVADQRGIAVGDVIPLSFWSTFDDFTTEPDTVVTALGVEHVTVVGIGTLADEVLPDRLYPRGQVLVSADVAEAYDCLPDLPRGDATVRGGGHGAPAPRVLRALPLLLAGDRWRPPRSRRRAGCLHPAVVAPQRAGARRAARAGHPVRPDRLVDGRRRDAGGAGSPADGCRPLGAGPRRGRHDGRRAGALRGAGAAAIPG